MNGWSKSLERISEKQGHLLVTANSPGEVHYWLWPLIQELQGLSPLPRVWVFVPPCQFATGKEVEVVRTFPLVERVFTPRETLLFALGFLPWKPPKPGLVLFLGGDLLYAVLLKRWTGYPLWVYGASPRWRFRVDRYLIRFAKDIPRFPDEKSLYVGDLLASAVAKSTAEPFFLPGWPRFLFLPGSRKFAYPALFPLFEVWARHLKERYPEASFALGLPRHYQAENLPEVAGVETFCGKTSELIQGADLVITVPGSNNLEIVYRGKRGIVVFPFSEALGDLPVMGPLAVLEKIPYWGKIIKVKIVRGMLEKTGWISLPNLLWGRELLPELKGVITMEQFLRTVEQVLAGKIPGLTPEEMPLPDASLRLSELIFGEWYGAQTR